MDNHRVKSGDWCLSEKGLTLSDEARIFTKSTHLQRVSPLFGSTPNGIYPRTFRLAEA